MPINFTGSPLINNALTQYSQPTTRCIGPLIGYGCMGTGNGINSFYGYAVPVFCGSQRSITTAIFEITSAASAGTTLEMAAYTTTSTTDPMPLNQIPNSLISTDPSTIGVKTLTYGSTWTAPYGLFYLIIKHKSSVNTSSLAIRAFEGTGRDNALIGYLLYGYHPTTPTNQYWMGGMLYISLGDNVSLPATISPSTILFDNDGNSAYGLFIR